MNYIKQLRAFEDWLGQNQCSASAQLLWYKLMSINNTCGWVEWFQRTNPSLMGMMNVAEKTLRAARNELCQKGLIEFQSGKKKNAPSRYKIAILYDRDILPLNYTPQITAQREPQWVPQREPQWVPQGIDINKPKQKPIEEEEEAFAQVINQVIAVTGRPIVSSFDSQQVQMWLNEYPMPLVMEAVRQAGLNGAAKPMPYIDTILLDWGKRGITTVEAAREAAQQKQLSARPGGKKKNAENWRALLSSKREEM